jgi:acyl-CoA synthetase (AMP-forming)/AMP-acid ligase II
VCDAVVVGTPHDRWGQQVHALVQLRAGCRPAPEDQIAHAARSIARYKLPKQVVFVEQMVRSPSGKPDYRWARMRACEAVGIPSS